MTSKLHVVLLHFKKSNASFLTLQLNYVMNSNLNNARNNPLAVGMLLVLLSVHVNLILLTFPIYCILRSTVHIDKSRHPLIIFAITINPSTISLTPLSIILHLHVITAANVKQTETDTGDVTTITFN